MFDKIMSLQHEDGSWNALKEGDKGYPEWNLYVPNYKSTLWTMILLADMEVDPHDSRLHRSLDLLSDQFLGYKAPIYSIGKSHYPIPCLNGNMLYLHGYFQHDPKQRVNEIVDFFATYQRFDDGDFKTPSNFPYYSNRSCYGKHTCYWGIVKLLKGLSFIPIEKRSENAKRLVASCIDFILLHEVCFSSREPEKYVNPAMRHLSFPNMYHSDFLEVLWLLKMEGVKSDKMERALTLLKNKRLEDGTWAIEKPIKDLIMPLTNKNGGHTFVTKRAGEVLDQYGIR